MQGITINSGIRNILSDLVGIQKQSDKNRITLSTGLRVNSAIDNADNYFTSVSLKRRSSELSALLDSMSNGIQTIQTTITTLDNISTTIKRLNFYTTTALKDVPENLWLNPDPPLTNEYLLSLSGVCAVARTTDDLLRIVESGIKGKIIITDHLTLNDTSLNLKQGQELVGIGHYAPINTNAIETNGRKSSLTFNFSEEYTGETTGIIMNGNNAIYDFDITVNTENSKEIISTKILSGNDNTIENIKITINNNNENNASTAYGLKIQGNSTSKISKVNSISYNSENQKSKFYGINIENNSILSTDNGSHLVITSSQTSSTSFNITAGSTVNINDTSLVSNNMGSSGVAISNAGNFNINGSSNIQIDSGSVGINNNGNLSFSDSTIIDLSSSSVGVFQGASGNTNISDKTKITIKTNNSGVSGGSITVRDTASLNIDSISYAFTKTSLTSKNSAKINIKTSADGFNNANIDSSGNSTFTVSANAVGINNTNNTVTFRDNSKLNMDTKSFAFQSSGGSVTFDNNCIINLTTSNDNSDIFKLIKGAILNVSGKTKINAETKGNKSDIIDLSQGATVNIGSQIELIGQGAFYENSLIYNLDDKTDSSVNLSKGAKIGFYNKVQDINRLWLVNENLNFATIGKTYNLSIEHLSDFTVIDDAVAEIPNTQRAEPTTTITKAWLESQADVGVVVTNIDELKAALASNTSKLIVVYGTIDVCNDVITLKDNQKVVGVGYFAERNSAAKDLADNKFSKLNFDYNYSLETSNNAITLGSNTILSDFEINMKHNYSKTSKAVYINNATDVNITDLDISITDTRTDASSSLRAIDASKSEYNLNGIINIKVHNNGLTATTLTGIYNTQSIVNCANNLDLRVDSKLNDAIFSTVYSNFNVSDNAKIVTTGNIRGDYGSSLTVKDSAEITTLNERAISYITRKGYGGSSINISGQAKISTDCLSISGNNDENRSSLTITDNADIKINSNYYNGNGLSIGSYVDAEINGNAKITVAASTVNTSNYHSVIFGSKSVINFGGHSSLKASSDRRYAISQTNAVVTFKENACLELNSYDRAYSMEGAFNANNNNSLTFTDNAKAKLSSYNSYGLFVGNTTATAGLCDSTLIINGNAQLDIEARNIGIYFASAKSEISGSSKISIDSNAVSLNIYSSDVSISENSTININSSTHEDYSFYVYGHIASNKESNLSINDNVIINSKSTSYNASVFQTAINGSIDISGEATINAQTLYDNTYLFNAVSTSKNNAINISAGTHINYYNNNTKTNSKWTVTDSFTISANSKIQDLNTSFASNVTDNGIYKTINTITPPSQTSISKSWLQSQTDVGAVVTTAAELKEAVNAETQGLIVVYGQIEMDMNDCLVLKENQKIVGIGYFAERNNAAKDSETNKFSQLIFKHDKNTITASIDVNNGSAISDLSIIGNIYTNADYYLIRNNNKSDVILNNLDMRFDNTDTTKANLAIYTTGTNSNTTIIGTNTFTNNETSAIGIVSALYTSNSSTININNAKIAIDFDSATSKALNNNAGSTININGASLINITSYGNSSCGIYNSTSIINIANTSTVYIDSYATAVQNVNTSSIINLKDDGHLKIESKSGGLTNSGIFNASNNSKIDILAYDAAFSTSKECNFSDNVEINLTSNYGYGIINNIGMLTISDNITMNIDSRNIGFINTSNSDVAAISNISGNSIININSDAQAISSAGNKNNGEINFFGNSKITALAATNGIDVAKGNKVNFTENSSVEITNIYDGQNGINCAGEVNFSDKSSLTINNALKAIYTTNEVGFFNASDSTTINIYSNQNSAHGFYSDLYSQINMDTAGMINVKLEGQSSHVHTVAKGSCINLSEKVNIASSTIYYNSSLINIINDGNTNTFNVSKQAIISYYNEEQKINSKWSAINNSSITNNGTVYNLVPSSDPNYSIIDKAKKLEIISTTTPETKVSEEWLKKQNDVAYVVTNAEELKQALNSKTEGLIVIYGQIELKLAEYLTMEQNQKIVGIGYFAERNSSATDSDVNKFSQLTITNLNTSNHAITMKGNNLLSDVEINYTSNTGTSIVRITGQSNIVNNCNLNYIDKRASGNQYGAISLSGDACLDIKGNTNIKSESLNTGANMYAVYMNGSSKVNIGKDTVLNADMRSITSGGFWLHQFSELNIIDNAKVNLDIKSSGIYSYQDHKGSVNISGNAAININSASGTAFSHSSGYSNVSIKDNVTVNCIAQNGISLGAGTNWSVSGNSKINLTTQGTAISSSASLTDEKYNHNSMIFSDNVELNINTASTSAYGIYTYNNSDIEFNDNCKIIINTTATNSFALYIGQNSKISANGTTFFDITTYSSGSDIVRLNSSDALFELKDSSKLKGRTYDAGAHLFYSHNTTETSLFKLNAGTSVEFKNPTNINAVWSIKEYIEEHIAKNKFIDDLSEWLGTKFEGKWAEEDVEIKEDIYIDDRDLSDIKRFMKICNDIANSLNYIILDGSYNGINLLNNDKLTIKYNNETESKTEIEGFNIKENASKFQNIDWEKQSDAVKYMQELQLFTQKVSTATSYYTNKINTIKVRQNFTDAFSAILEEGADKLVLADMNEVCANELAIQSRQQLALNALSLSANSARSILQLF